MTPDCPTDQSLRMYAIGDLDEMLCEEIERHIGDCPACEETVAQFDSVDDTLIRHLPLAAGADARKVTEAPGWLARLRKGPPAGVAVEDRPEDLEPWPAVVLEESGPGELAAYELLGVLGRGGMGVVYRARHRQLQRHVALKVLNPRLMATPEGVRRFEREIRILGGLRHGGIVMATDAGRVRGSAYLVMELVEGIDLSRLVKQGGPLPIGEACEVARQMAEALAAAHEAGTVHRDVKPSNVMIDAHGRIKLLDFGLARLAALSTQSLETSVGCLLGTLDYMAPEQADSDQPTDPRADFFGLGATLFYLLTGRPPRGGVQRSSLLQQLSSLTADAPRVSTIRADVPPELDDFLARLLTRNPQERPDSARAIAAELSQWAGGDLATRVQEFPKQTEEAPTDDGAAAQRSLSELLGKDSIVIGGNSIVSSDQPTAAAPRRSGRGRNWIWPTALGSLAAAGAIFFGVTIVLQMQQGTLRIESEADNVQVEIVDDKDQTTDLKIDRTGKETKLFAGQYRLRLTGQHDGIVLDNNTVTLTRGKQTVARITREKTANRDEVFHATGNGGFILKEKHSKIIATKAPLATVDGFDSHILKVTATDKPNEIRVEALSGHGNISTRLILVDRKGGRFLVDVLVDEHEPPFPVGSSGKAYLPSNNTGGHLNVENSTSPKDGLSLVGGHKVDHVKLEQKLKVLFPNSTVHLYLMSGKIIVKGQAKDSEEAARILSLISGEVINQAGSPAGSQPMPAPGIPKNIASDFIVNMLGGHGDVINPRAEDPSAKIIAEVPALPNPVTRASRYVYYIYDSLKPTTQEVTTSIRGLEDEGYEINEIDQSIINDVPDRTQAASVAGC